MTLEFEAWPKIPRWANETMSITEKIDGTNACVVIHQLGDDFIDLPDSVIAEVKGDNTHAFDTYYSVQVQSRKRFITPGKDTDNAGFAGWVRDNAEALVHTLGPGRHYGEWYGRGIQRSYGLDHKRFALFNPWRYTEKELSAVENLETVPVLYEDTDDMISIDFALRRLEETGSAAVAGYCKPEGVVVHFKLSKATYKAFCWDDGRPKSVK